MYNKSMIKIGHRGAAGYEPENTLASFKKALQLGVDGVEFDVYALRDGTVVVMHDKKVDRTTNGKGSVTEKSLQELKQLDAGKGEKIPTLQEVLDVVDGHAQVNIELKGEQTAGPVANIIKDYVQHKGWKYNDFFVSSFNHKELKRFKELLPNVKIGVLIIGLLVRFDQYKKIDAYSVNMFSKLIRKSTVEKAHKHGLKVYAYTVNTEKEIEKMKNFQVDGIISDYPDRIK